MIRYLPLLLLTVAAPALAQSVTIENFIGRVKLVSGDTLEITGGQPGTVDMQRGDVVVDGGESVKNISCSMVNGRTFIRTGGWIGGKKTGLDTFPTLTVTAPASTALIVRDAVLFGEFADLGDVDMKLGSCGRAEFSNVSGLFEVGLSGSADVSAGNVGEASLRTSGSGNFEIGTARSLGFSSSGSGDLQARDVEGPVELRTSGSGDVVIARAGDGLSFSSTGSGDLLAGRVDGAVEVRSTGSGDAEIDAGEVTSLDVRTTGSGHVEVGGSVGAVDVMTTGSGGVTLASQSGPISFRSTGSGKIVVDGEAMSRR